MLAVARFGTAMINLDFHGLAAEQALTLGGDGRPCSASFNFEILSCSARYDHACLCVVRIRVRSAGAQNRQRFSYDALMHSRLVLLEPSVSAAFARSGSHFSKVGRRLPERSPAEFELCASARPNSSASNRQGDPARLATAPCWLRPIRWRSGEPLKFAALSIERRLNHFHELRAS